MTYPSATKNGFPHRQDRDVERAMSGVRRLPYSQVEEIVRNLYRAAIAYDRTQDPSHLRRLADDALATTHLREHTDIEKWLLDAPTSPGDPADANEVSDVLARLGVQR